MSRPDQAPWEDEPYQDHKLATERALSQARLTTGEINPAQRHYAEKAFNNEIKSLSAQSKGARNDTLNRAAFSLARLVAASALDECKVRQALYDACQTNGHLQDDGQNMVLGTIESGMESGLKHPRDLSHVCERSVHLDMDEPRAKPVVTVRDIEAGFWTKRDSLQSIYIGALSRMCSPWAVLAYCAARALTLVPPTAVLPAVIGGPGSLNWYAAVVARSSGGKSSANAVSRELVASPIMTRNLGSGEGLIDAYVKPANKETGELRGWHEAIMFTADEMDTMAALRTRSGSTLSGLLRSAFTAETLGFSYRTSSSEHLQSHTYRMTLVTNVQPKKSGSLLDDQYGGMLQRFMWFPADDDRIEVVTPQMPAALTLPPHTAWQYPCELKVPYIAKHLIKQERVKSMRGQQDQLDGHALFAREKFAYALAVLDGRHVMTEDDWRLAGVASRISDHTRSWVADELATTREDEADKTGQLHGVSNAAAREKEAQITFERSARIRNNVLKKISAAGVEGVSDRTLTNQIAYRDRKYLNAILNALASDGRIKREKNTWLITQCNDVANSDTRST